MRIKVEDPDPAAAPQYLPKAGDYLTLFYALEVTRNDGQVVAPLQPVFYEKPYATRDGVIFTLKQPQYIQSVSRIGGTDNLDITFEVADESAVKAASYQISTTAGGKDSAGKGFVSLLISTPGGELTVDSLYTGDSFDFDGLSNTPLPPPRGRSGHIRRRLRAAPPPPCRTLHLPHRGRR